MKSSVKSSFKIKCPICKKEVGWEETPTRPFCSERCRLIDLGSWASGEYCVPGREVLNENEDEKEQF